MLANSSLGENFWYLRLAQILSLLGDQLVLIVLPFYLLQLTNNVTTVALVLSISNLTSIAVTLIMGVVADQVKRKTLIIAGTLCKGFCWLVILVLFSSRCLDIALLTSIYLLAACSGAMVAAGVAGILPEVITSQFFSKGIAVVFSSNALIKITAGLLGALVLSNFSLAFLVSPFLYLLSNIFLYKLKLVHKTHKTVDVASSLLLHKFSFTAWKNALFAGVRYFSVTFEYRRLFMTTFLLQMFVAPLQLVLPIAIKTYYPDITNFYGCLIAGNGVGAIIATLVIPYLINKLKSHQIINFSLLLAASTMLVLSIWINKYGLVLCSSIFATAIFTITILLQSGLLQTMQDQFRSRAFTLIFFLEGVAAQFAIFAAGWFIDHFGLLNLFLCMSLGLFTLTILTAKLHIFDFLWRTQSHFEY
ncbi:MAG: MFS transporter [Gammaproteobacteria bacterium]|nr:MFS transporter [Gammaproteobacteria bacterium]